jgi:dihydroneopterin aldolase
MVESSQFVDMNRMRVGLEGLEVYAYHGVHAEERQLGNRFTVDIWADVAATVPPEQLADTLDYGVLGSIAQQHLEQPTPLLETLCWAIARQVLDQCPLALVVQVRLRKHNPPLGTLCQASFAELTLNR